MIRALRVEADGGSRGNPGVAGYGALVRGADGRVLAERAAPLGKASNNVAEYSGLIAGLEAALAIDPGASITVAMDSKLVIEQMSGRWKIKHEDMRRLALRARDLVAEVVAAGGSVRFTWIPRADNKDADKLSNDGMDGLTVCRDLPPTAPAEASGEKDDEVAVGSDATSALDARLATMAFGAASRRPEPTRIALVRHGVTANTEGYVLDGRGGVDPCLSERGREQARRAAALVADLVGSAPVRLVTSDLVRARETGAIIGERLGVEADADPAWDEQNFGDWDGAALPHLLGQKPVELGRLRSDPDYRRPGGESHRDLAARVGTAYEHCVAAGGTHVIVCHRKPILVVLERVLGLAMETAWRVAASPGSLTGIEAWPDGAATLVFSNRT